MVEGASAFRRRSEFLPSGRLTKMTQAMLDPMARVLERVDIRTVLWVVTALCLEDQGLYKMESIWDGMFTAGFSVQEAVSLAMNMKKYMSSLQKSEVEVDRSENEPATRPLQGVQEVSDSPRLYLLAIELRDASSTGFPVHFTY